jgi:hypothetical protein
VQFIAVLGALVGQFEKYREAQWSLTLPDGLPPPTAVVSVLSVAVTVATSEVLSVVSK